LAVSHTKWRISGSVTVELRNAHTETTAEQHRSTQRLTEQRTSYEELLADLRTQLGATEADTTGPRAGDRAGRSGRPLPPTSGEEP
jgi:hypothetical protein